MHRHGSFLEMKVIIQLSVLTRRLEDTDSGQKPVQIHKGQAPGLACIVICREYNARVRGATDSDRKELRGFDLEGDPFAARAFVHVAVCFNELTEREDPRFEWQ